MSRGFLVGEIVIDKGVLSAITFACRYAGGIMDFVYCNKCGSPVNPKSKKCQRCGTAVETDAKSNSITTSGQTADTTQAKSAKVQGVLLGIATASVGLGCLIPLGIVLCFTGIGALVGIPLILLGLFYSVFEPLKGLGALKGECPWCGMKVLRPEGGAVGVTCQACKKRIVIKNGRFVKIE